MSISSDFNITSTFSIKINVKSYQYILQNQSKITLRKNSENVINFKDVYYIAKLFEVTNPARQLISIQKLNASLTNNIFYSLAIMFKSRLQGKEISCHLEQLTILCSTCFAIWRTCPYSLI